jgi:hypothetical protein
MAFFKSSSAKARGTIHRAVALLTTCLCVLGAGSQKAAAQAYSLFSANDTPGTADANDTNPVELGVQFQSSVAGTVTAIRFYKGPLNTGTHVGNLWSASGTLLATATFSNETSSGWQQVNFSSPVPITANTIYVASYHNGGEYAADNNYFNTAHTNYPLTAPATGNVARGNGVYVYGSTSAFPTNTYLASNYWVDVVFQPSSSTTPPGVAMTAPAPGATVANLLTLWATASDTVGVAGVQFLLDGASLGSEVTSPPYTITWDTRGATPGSHTLAARARNTSGLTTTSSPVTVTVDNSGNPAVVGSWSSVVNIPAVAVNLVLLKNNKVLFYQDGATPTVWDYVNGSFTGVPTSANIFCSGAALLADGRVLAVGGFGGGNQDGIANAEIFDPANNSWTAVPNMSFKRWYPTATTLGDGTILVTAGWQTGPHDNVGIPEIYNASSNTWTQLTSANNPFETYPFLYLLSDGRVIHVGGTEYPTATDILDLNSQTWSVVDSNVVDGRVRS